MFSVDSRSVLHALMPALVAGAMCCCGLCEANAGDTAEQQRTRALVAAEGAEKERQGTTDGYGL